MADKKKLTKKQLEVINDLFQGRLEEQAVLAIVPPDELAETIAKGLTQFIDVKKLFVGAGMPLLVIVRQGTARHETVQVYVTL